MFEVNDSPIQDASGDKYGFENLSETIARCISENESKEGIVLSVTGKWGSGKSSLINIVADKLSVGVIGQKFNSLDKEDGADIKRCWN